MKKPIRRKQEFRKIPCTLSLTSGQVGALEEAAAPLGITMQDFLRRMIDGWMEAGVVTTRAPRVAQL